MKRCPPPALLAAFLLAASFSPARAVSFSTVTYDSSGELYPNPGRGFSAYRSSSISLPFLQGLRDENVTVVQRIYTIPQFNDSPLSSQFLSLVEHDFNAARDGGAKLVLRFSYTNDIDGEDASLATILGHIDQLEPLLQEHGDVILYVEAGFIGAWGEWFYSTHGLNNTEDRRTVLFALLDALPTDRMVAVRTPAYKRAIFEVDEPLDYDEAFNGTRRARTGAHNDCFLASADDYGTYDDIEADKTYLNLDNRFVPQGGETCSPSAYSDCAHALTDLARMRWSVLNRDYNQAVLDGWEAEGCMDEIRRRLGHRFRLLSATLQDSVRPGGAFSAEFDIVNDGFASPFNPRGLELILREDGGAEYFLATGEDPRFWLGGDTAHVALEGGIPAGMPTGSYELLLALPDPAPALYLRPEYSIRLANTGVWDDMAGYNDMLHEVVVSPGATGGEYGGDLFFLDRATSVPPATPHGAFPAGYHLLAAYPNPFNPRATLRFEVPRPDFVRLAVYDLLGQRVAILLDRRVSSGEHELTWNANGLSSGVYLLRMEAGGASFTRKVVLLK